MAEIVFMLVGVAVGIFAGYFLAAYNQSKELIRLYKTTRDLEVKLLQYEEMIQDEIELGLEKMREKVNNDD